MLKTPEKWTLDTEEKEMQIASECKKKAIIHKKENLNERHCFSLGRATLKIFL